MSLWVASGECLRGAAGKTVGCRRALTTGLKERHSEDGRVQDSEILEKIQTK